jgi:hypothetical protein
VTVRDSGNDNSRNFDESFNDNSTDDDIVNSGNDSSSDDDTEFDDFVSGNNSAGGDLDRSVEDNDDTEITDNLNGSAVDFGRGSAVNTDDIDGDPTF